MQKCCDVYHSIMEIYNFFYRIVCLQSRDSDEVRNSDGGQGVKSRMDEMAESLYCTGLHTITRERYKQKITKYVGCDPYAMKRSDFSTELKCLPAIEAVDISNYLVLQTSFYSRKQMKAYKSMEDYNFFVSGWVNDLGTTVLHNDLVFAWGHAQSFLCTETTPPLAISCHRMSRSPDLKEDPMECPLCMEPLEIDDVNFFPCTCGYQICRFCWHRIRTDENGLCPACRKPYPEDPAVYKPLSQEELQRIKNEKKQKQNERKQKITENRKHLASVRVVQRNLVFVVGLSQRLADPEVLKKPEYFGKFGKIHKVVINSSTSYAGSQGPSASAYVTYIRSEDALRAIQCVNNVVVDGRTLKASLGTTKYCSYFLKSMQCPKPDCMYLHELGDEAASFTKEEMQAGKHQEYEQKLLQELYKMNPSFLQTSTGTGEKTKSKSGSVQSSNNINKDAWPSLQPMGKMSNGLPELRKSPPLDGGSDCEHLTPDGPDSELGLGPLPALSPFSSNCEPASPSENPTEAISIGNGETPQIPCSDSPSPPPGVAQPCIVAPANVAGLTVRSPFDGAGTESQSLFSDNSNFRHPNPIPSSSSVSGFPSSTQSNTDWPTAPEPQSLFTSDTIPVSSSTDWQAAFGFGSSAKQQDDDLGFDPFDITSKALADLIEKELSVQDKTLSPMSHVTPAPGFPPHIPSSLHSAKGPMLPPASSTHLPLNCGLAPRAFSNHLQHPQLSQRPGYNSFSLPGHAQTLASRHSWLAMTARANLPHLNHTTQHNSSFLDLSLTPQQQQQQHSTGLGGIPITGSVAAAEPEVK
ncbi:CCR4-NOT transcription complex subunit 4 isoform X6 [Ictalurus punctatus]|uniref:CCR4-NOT transcription complex subunit 4 n=1 Tax=Ictalurus punctatus TaxID=7998 RepID=A0A2D0T526_ICTPU|nr:CCR4-NOT transcription complex subunit 4 isoform X6 [Ictalurus punctatus]